MISLLNGARHGALVATCLWALAACGDDDETTANPDGSVGNLDAGVDAFVPSDSSIDGATPPATASQFVFTTAVTIGSATTSYVKAVNDVDSNVKVDLKQTLEAAGFGDIWVLGDKVFVSDSSPTLKRYTINADNTFSPDGAINFQTYSASASIFSQSFVSADKAVLKGDSSWVVWNPSTLQIITTIPFPAQVAAAKNGLHPFFAYDRGFHARGNRLYQAVNWADYENYKLDPTSAIVVINLDTNSVASVLESQCPGLDTITEDAQQNLYVSGWVWGPASTLVQGGSKGCIEKIPAGSESLDASGQLKWSEITGGREGAGFRFLRGSTFLFSVFRDDTIPAFNPASDKLSTWAESANWQYATYDIGTKQYKVLDSLPKNSGGFYYAKSGDKFYLLTPGAGYTSTSYQQLLADGTVKDGIYMDGWSLRLFPVTR